MRAKLILIALLMLPLLLVSAANTELSYTLGYNCYDSDYIPDEDCNLVIGHVHRLEEIPDGGIAVDFPEKPVPMQLVGCTDPTAVALARYENGNWIPQTGEVSTENGITVEAYIEQPGDYALIKKSRALGFEVDLCEESGCRGNGPFVTNPYNIYLDEFGDSSLSILESEDNINLKFCGMTPGCQVHEDGICDQYEKHCLKGVALDCEPTSCTNEPDKCCNPARGDGCDPDCEGTGFTSPDYDCQFKDADALAGLDVEIEEKEFDEDIISDEWIEHTIDLDGGKIVNGAVTFEVGEGDNPSNTLWFKDFMYQDFNDNWRLLFPARQSPNGHTFNNFLGNTKEINWEDIKEYTEKTASKSKFKEYTDAYDRAKSEYDKQEALETGTGDRIFRNSDVEVDTDVLVGGVVGVVGTGAAFSSAAAMTLAGSAAGPVGIVVGGFIAVADWANEFLDDESDYSDHASAVFWAHPAVWLQGTEDKEVSQFWFVNTPIKKIKFKSRSSNDGLEICDTTVWCDGVSNGISDFTVKFPAYETTDLIDPDGDGVSSGIDCHDANDKIYPGAEEICDGIDNNCNSFTLNMDKEKAEIVDYLELDSERDTPTSQSNIYQEHYWFVSDSAVMPCDGFIHFKEAIGGAYVEVKRIDTLLMPGPMSEEDITDYEKIWPYAYPDFIYQINEPLYTGEIFDLPGYFGFDLETTLNTSEKIIDFFGYENDTAKDRHQVIYAGLDNVAMKQGVINVHANNILEKNNYGAYPGKGTAGCKIGMLDSCTCLSAPIAWGDGNAPCKPEFVQSKDSKDNAVGSNKGYFIDPLPSPDQVKAWNRNANGYKNTILHKTLPSSSEGTELDTPDDIELKKGDLVKYYVNKGGYIEAELYCYKEGDPNPEKIDEGCEEIPVEVHVCKTKDFIDTDVIKKCQEPLCAPSTISKTQVQYAQEAGSITANCDISISGQYQSGDTVEFYTYLCPEGEDCYQFYDGQFNVCGATEICGNGFDDDCDGFTDRDDIDCEGKCYEGECDIALGQWCVNSQWTADSYCINCGHTDSTCQKTCDPSVAEEEFKSCNSGCLEGACDTAANLICTNGLWVETGYATKCKAKDADSPSCDEALCDTQQNVTCIGGSWKSDGYCLTKCGKKDESCHAERKDKFQETPYCETGAYDLYANKWCNQNHEWTTSEYCNRYGAYDSDCGPKACTERITLPDGTEKKNCDYIHQKYCQNGKWTSEGYCSLQNCGADIKSRNVGGEWGKCSSCEETGTEEGPACMDGVDNDCDGYIDCDDSDCPADLEGCSCNTGEEKQCYSDPFNRLGLCATEPGTQKCVNDRWDTCEGAFTPQMEVCNGFDDDCDGSTDEGCGGCGTGETRNCGVDQGACSAGVQECDETGHWTICFGAGYKKAEPEECDGKDNDCDESIDEGCGCQEGQTQQCGDDIGECELGEQSCIDGKWGACLGGKSKLSETGSQCSDNKDNDCDGKTDSEDENCQTTSSLKPVCYDGKQNQDEEEIDCGGENCPPCDQVTCNDRQRNGDEEGIDCGGTRDCPTCREKQTTKTKTATKEKAEEDTGKEALETFEEEKGFPWMYLMGGIVVLGGILLLLYNKFGKQQAAGKEQRATATARTMTKLTPQQQPQAKPTRQKITQSKDESALAKSIEESKKLFKK